MQLWPLFVPVVLAAAAFLWWRRRDAKRYSRLEQTPYYKRRDSILSPNEKAYFDVVSKSMGGRTMVLPKVRLSELVEHPGNVAQFRAHWTRVQRRYVDFLICDHNTFPVLAILMESRSDQRKRSQRDDVLTETLIAAEIPVLQVIPQNEYDSTEVVQEIKFALMRENDRIKSGRDGDDELDATTLPRRLKRWTSDLWVSMRGA